MWRRPSARSRSCTGSASTSTTASSSCSSARRAAASRPCCAWWRAWRAITGGTIAIGDRVVNNLPPAKRDIAMVFQSYALYPHKTVAQNMAFSLKLREDRSGRDRRAGQAGGRNPRPDALSRPLSAPALRRPAPARRHGPRHRARSAGVPVRRAAVQSRRQAARADAHRDQGTAPAPEDDHDLRHPRPGRGDDHGRQDRRHAGRAHRAGRRAAGTVRPAGEPLRGGLHRLAVDEPAEGHGSARRAERRRGRRREPAFCRIGHR